MTELECKVYSVLLEECDYRTGLVQISAERIALGEPGYPESGVCTNVGRVKKALGGLRDKCVIKTVDPGGGRSRVPTHQLLQPLVGMPLFVEMERGTDSVPQSAEQKGDAQRPQRGTESGAKGDAQRPQRGTPAVPRSAIARNCSSSGGDAARLPKKTGTVRGPLFGREEEEKVLKFLTDKGVWPGTREQYATLLQLAEAQEIWRSLVNDKHVQEKGRPGAFFKRLTQFLHSKERLRAA
jgi:hypothetical protein